MAGIGDLAFGALKKFGGDALGDTLSPTQKEFLSFILSPQGYVLNKGIGALANAAGFGDDYQGLQDSKKANDRYAKDVFRDSVSDMLPNSVGNLLRVTPKNVSDPAGAYFDLETNQWVYPAEPVDPFAIDRFNANGDPNSMYNSESPTFVGPKLMHDSYGNFSYDLGNMDLGNTDPYNFSGFDLDGMDIGNFDFNNSQIFDDGSFLTDNFDYGFSRGGQIYRGRR